MLKIGEFSKLANITIKMLRHYDELGLLIPDKIDKFTGYRYYSAIQLDRANKIGMFKAMGFSLTTIKELLNDENDFSVLKKHFNIRKIELNEERTKLQNQIKLFDEISGRIDRMNNIKYNVIQKVIRSRKVISIRKNIPNYELEGQLWEELYNIIHHNNIEVKYEGHSMAIYHDKDYRENNVDIELQETVIHNYDNIEGVKFFTTEEMLVASVTFNGNYDQC